MGRCKGWDETAFHFGAIREAQAVVIHVNVPVLWSLSDVLGPFCTLAPRLTNSYYIKLDVSGY